MKVTSPESPKHQPNDRILVALSEILSLLTKQAGRLKGKAKAAMIRDGEWRIDLKAPKSVLKFGKKTTKKKQQEEEECYGIWQKEILMGIKCEPLDYSGVIYYDINGKRTTEFVLRSTCASPTPNYLMHR